MAFALAFEFDTDSFRWLSYKTGHIANTYYHIIKKDLDLVYHIPPSLARDDLPEGE